MIHEAVHNTSSFEEFSDGTTNFTRQALQEATEIDHRYGRIMNPNLQHYHVPVNADVHLIETMFVEEDDTIVNPLGVKGMGSWEREAIRASSRWCRGR